MNKKITRYGFFVFWSAILLVIDQWTKHLAYTNLRSNGPLVLWDGVFELLYSENRGAAFGILQGRQTFFLLIAAAVVLAVLFGLYQMPDGKRYLPLYGCMVLLASGAVGNLIDRTTRGFVVDFFYFKLIDFPIFNVADCYVVVSAALLILLTGLFYKEEELNFLSGKPNRKPEEESAS